MAKEKIKLKMIVHKNQRVHIISLMIGLFIFLYFLVGHFHIGQPTYFPLTLWERDIPLSPATIWIYISLYPVLIWQAFSFHNVENLNRLTYAFSCILVISCFIFFCYPVAYPREFFPLGPHFDITHYVFRFIRFADKPVNCFPSLHVGSIFLMAFGIRHESFKKFIIGLFAALLISFSTLTTKQHYLADVISGLFLAFVLYYIFWHMVNIKKY